MMFHRNMNKQLNEANNDLNGELSMVKNKLDLLEPKKGKISLHHELGEVGAPMSNR